MKLTTFSLCSGIPKQNLLNGINTGKYAATSFENLVKFDVTPEIMFLICVPSYGYWVKIGL